MDIKPITEVLKLMMRELPDDRVADCLSRFRYQRINMGRLCKDKLDKICQQYLKTPWDDIDHDHCSWMCDTTSIADRGFSKHRWPDGSPRSDKALEHDECLKVVAALYRGKARRRPEKLITMEQPENNIFLGLQPVRNMVGDQGWQILRASHCKASGSAMDKAFQQNNRFSQKDSIYVVHGVQSDPPLQLTGMCNNDCIQRLTTQPTRHKMLICSSSRMLDGQEKIHDVTVKSRIPYGIWHRLWLSNCVVNGLARDLRRDEAAINAVHVIGRRPCSGELLHGSTTCSTQPPGRVSDEGHTTRVRTAIKAICRPLQSMPSRQDDETPEHRSPAERHILVRAPTRRHTRIRSARPAGTQI